MSKSLTNDFNDIVLQRRSIREYDPNVKISKEEMADILAKAVRAPSSVNMQPWRFVVIETEEMKEKLKPLVQFNQKQLDTSSAMIAIFGDLNNFDYAEEIYGTAVEKGLMPAEVKEKQLSFLTEHFGKVAPEVNKRTVLIDGGLVSMQLMLIARSHGYDTNPIGGFDREAVAELLKMDKTRYLPIMLLSIGKAAEEGYQSVRLPVERITEWV
ncbi:nitroreductase family protein [Amphibacillus cookii]|uniref:nitroreductase family protein n=1 Tax=Amphibacillus cookii TaxID=767787 RepID=UPI0019592B68|nr:nitroreductase family protein [Amphibacillus cookii]MBM7542595.1 nitroreductase [Amphibacillus cookii]